MASQKTIVAKLGVQQRAEATRQAAQERLAETHPSIPRTSTKYMGRTKGLPFSRMLLKNVTPCKFGQPAILTLAHPTKKRGRQNKIATPELLRVFFPSLPENFAAAMLGI